MENGENLPESISAYGKIRAFAGVFNDINRGEGVPLMILDSIGLGVCTVYSVIALHSKLPLAVLLFSFLLAVDTLWIINFYIIGAGAEVHELSSNLKTLIQKIAKEKRDKVIMRKAKACSIMKVYLGQSGNFLELLTPLNLFQFMIDQVTSLLLLN